MLLIGAAEVVEAECSELQQLFLRAEVVSDGLVEEHVDAFRD